jgi:hypothetical protein
VKSKSVWDALLSGVSKRFIGNEMISVKNAGERSGGTTRNNQQPTVD